AMNPASAERKRVRWEPLISLSFLTIRAAIYYRRFGSRALSTLLPHESLALVELEDELAGAGLSRDHVVVLFGRVFVPEHQESALARVPATGLRRHLVARVDAHALAV